MSKLYRPTIKDPSQKLSKRIKKLKNKTSLPIAVLQKKSFELGLSALEKEVK